MTLTRWHQVFLCEADTDQWQSTARAVLGDFGMAVEAEAEGLYNPDDYTGRGTTVYMAPVSPMTVQPFHFVNEGVD